MSKRAAVLITAAVGTVAFGLSRLIWPDPPGAAVPPASLVPFLMVPALFESLALGAGVVFLVAGGRYLARVGQPQPLVWATYLSVAWSLVSWWPHSNLHRVSTSLASLAAIEWTFHVTLVVAACVIAVFAVRVLHAAADHQPSPASEAPAAAGGRP
jgi:hypothetical protein